MITPETRNELLIIYSIFNNNNINISFKGVSNTPFIKKIIISLNMDDIKNINKIKLIIKTLETLLNTSILFYFDNNDLIIELKQKNKNIYNFECYFKCDESLKNKNLIFMGLNKELKPIYKNIIDLKSILIAGTSGSGKSNLIHNILISYLLLNDNSYLLCIDPKYTELQFYNKTILKNRIIADPAHTKDEIKNNINIFINLIKSRFKRMQKQKQQTSAEPIALLVIDEYASLFNTTKEKNEINNKISYIASIGRASNCFLILSTQHPTNQNINNTIRSNLQTRIALHCESIQQSKNIIDTTEATKIDAPGEAILKTEAGSKDILKACFISNELIKKILS